MKTALTLTCKDCRNPALLQTIRNAGFSGINFTYDETLFSDADPEALLRSIKANLDTAGLACPQVILPNRGSSASCDYYDPETEDRIAFALKTMPVLGAAWGALQPLSAVNSCYCPEKAMADNLVRFRKYAELARQAGVGIAVENPLPLQEQPEQRFCADPQTLCAFVDQLALDNVGICWNFGHANHLGKDLFGRNTDTPFDHAAALRLLGSRVKIVHISDNFGDGHWRLTPGVGKLSEANLWPELLAILLKNGFPGFCTLDCDLEQGRRVAGLEHAYLTLSAKASAAYVRAAAAR